MENISKIPINSKISLEEQLERQYKQKQQEQRIALMRSFVLKKQITEAYQILENIRFDYLGDTAFREKIVKAKSNLELAINDFLLDDNYHREKINWLNKMTPREYDDYLKSFTGSAQS